MREKGIANTAWVAERRAKLLDARALVAEHEQLRLRPALLQVVVPDVRVAVPARPTGALRLEH